MAVYTSAWLCGSLAYSPERALPCEVVIPDSASTTGAYARRFVHGPVGPYPEMDAYTSRGFRARTVSASRPSRAMTPGR